MDINNNNTKIYTFKLDFDAHGYCLINNQSVYEFYQKTCHNNASHECKPKNGIISLYDINNNTPKLLNFICQIDQKDIEYFYSSGSDTNGISCTLIPSYENDNIYFKDIYNDLPNYTKNTNDIYFKYIYNKPSNYTTNINDTNYRRCVYNCIRGSILKNEIIHILINNFCKLHYIENIKVTLRVCPNNINHNPNHINPDPNKKCLESITFIIDETKKSNNRKIKFYEHFSDFYRTKNKDINYKIIQEPIEDGHCLIEEIEKVIEPIQNIEQKQEVIKTSEDIIKEKDAEINKLKKEIEELKKFYINS